MGSRSAEAQLCLASLLLLLFTVGIVALCLMLSSGPPVYLNTEYIHQAIRIKSNARKGISVCSVAYSKDSCPNYKKISGNLKVFAFQRSFLEDSSLISTYEKSSVSLQKDPATFLYNARQKFRVKGAGDDPEEQFTEKVFESKDFNWNNNIPLSYLTSTTINAVDIDPEFKEIEYHCSKGPLYQGPSYKEPGAMAKLKKLTNWMRTAFGLKALNITLTIGFSSDWPTMTSQILAVGIAEEYGMENTIRQNTLCQCLKTMKGKLAVDYSRKEKMCFHLQSTWTELQKLLDEKMCILDEMIQAFTVT